MSATVFPIQAFSRLPRIGPPAEIKISLWLKAKLGIRIFCSPACMLGYTDSVYSDRPQCGYMYCDGFQDWGHVRSPSRADKRKKKFLQMLKDKFHKKINGGQFGTSNSPDILQSEERKICIFHSFISMKTQDCEYQDI